MPGLRDPLRLCLRWWGAGPAPSTVTTPVIDPGADWWVFETESPGAVAGAAGPAGAPGWRDPLRLCLRWWGTGPARVGISGPINAGADWWVFDVAGDISISDDMTTFDIS